MTNFNSNMAVSSEVASRNGSNLNLINAKIHLLNDFGAIKKSDGRSAMYKVTYYLGNKKYVDYLDNHADLNTLIAYASINWNGFWLTGIAEKSGNSWASYSSNLLDYFTDPQFVQCYLLKADIVSAMNDFVAEHADYTYKISDPDYYSGRNKYSYSVSLVPVDNGHINYDNFACGYFTSKYIGSSADIDNALVDFADYINNEIFDSAVEECHVYDNALALNKILAQGYGDYNAMADWRNGRLHDSEWGENEYRSLIEAIDNFGYSYNDTYHVAAQNMGVDSLSSDDGFVIGGLDNFWWFKYDSSVAIALADLVDIREYCVNKVNNMAC